MVLAFFGEHRSEDELSKLLKTTIFGTPISNIRFVQYWGYRVDLGSFSAENLKSFLQEGKPVIARVWTVMLDDWTMDTSHVVVVIGFDETHVYMNDPAFADAPRRVLWDGFLAAWEEFDQTSAVIAY